MLKGKNDKVKSPKMKIKKGDKVIVVAGRDKGRKGDILRVLPKENRAVVSGINVAVRHVKQSANSQGGLIRQELAINVSNLALVDPASDKPTRVGYKFMEDGRKVRFARSSGEIIND